MKMDRIVRKHLRQKLVKGSKREYYEKAYNIYTLEEAKKNKLDYKYWKEAKAGEYGLTDDNYVAKCIKRRTYSGRVNVVYPFGQQFINKSGSGKLEYEPHKFSGSFSMISSKKAWETKKGKTLYKQFAKIYALMTLAGKVNYQKLGKALGDSEALPSAKAKALLKKEWMQDMVNEEIKKHLDKKGIDEGNVIDMINEAYEIAKTKKDPSNMLRASENFVNILGMKASTKDLGVDHMAVEGVSLESIVDTLNPAKEVKSDGKEDNDVSDADMVVG
tara:strand:- start:1855 stop:2676 length:822 start_codon:yes stop_codon:yes gene_type:complete